VATSSLIFMKPQAYTEFQPLEDVLVGRGYNIEFFESLDIPFTPKTKRLMTYLLDETEEDIQNLANTLTTLGVTVRRPSFNAYKTGHGHHLAGAYLMTPRDDQIVIDNKLVMGQYHTSLGKGFATCLEDYKDHFLPDPVFKNIACASIIRLGEDIIVDSNEFASTEKHVERLKKYFEPLGYNIIFTKTHNFKFKNDLSHADSIFAILKPGLIIHAKEDSHYSENIFKGWDFIKVENEERSTQNLAFRTFRRKREKFQIECSYAFEDSVYDDNKWFDFLDTWFTSLMGYSKETYFDINCLVVDEENVIVNTYSKKFFKQLEQNKINPILVPFRHRLFWDGGTHCITLDLKRKGSREKYL